MSNKFPLMLSPCPGIGHPFTPNLSSFIVDIVARQKLAWDVSDANFLLKQLPSCRQNAIMSLSRWAADGTIAEWIGPRWPRTLLHGMGYGAVRARIWGTIGAPFVWDKERRFKIRAELDAAFFHLYGVGAMMSITLWTASEHSVATIPSASPGQKR